VAQPDIKGNYYFKREFPRGGVKILAQVFEKDASKHMAKFQQKKWVRNIRP
jgi:hypothetical protein